MQPLGVAVGCLAAGAMLVGCGASHQVRPPTDAELMAAVMRVEVEGCDSPDLQDATAMLVSTDDGESLLATVAHTFVADGSFAVRRLMVTDVEGDQIEATVIYLDPGKDIALLQVTTDVQPLSIGALDEDAGLPTARLVGFGSAVRPVEILRQTTVTLDGDGEREALELEGRVERGSSGSPIVNDQGAVIGMVFATSTVDDVAWAVTGSELATATTGPRSIREPGC